MTHPDLGNSVPDSSHMVLGTRVVFTKRPMVNQFHAVEKTALITHLKKSLARRHIMGNWAAIPATHIGTIIVERWGGAGSFDGCHFDCILLGKNNQVLDWGKIVPY